LYRRLVEVGGEGVSVLRLGGDRRGEMQITRFLRNRKVSVAEMVATAAARTAGLVAGRHVLAIQDTTSVRERGDGSSIALHPSIVVDAVDGALLGLIHAELLGRQGGQRAKRKQQPFADKQSRRWLRAAEAAARLGAEGGAALVTVIADREGDIYEEFALRPAGVELLIRAAQDRLLADGGRLFEHAQRLPEAGRMSVELPAAPGRPARQAMLAVRFGAVVIACPKSRDRQARAHLPEHVPLSLVELREVAPPAGAAPVHWRLLTSHPVESYLQACAIARLYRRRWTIEQLFRTMKTKGFDIEAVRIADHGPFENLSLAILLAAITVLQLVHERDGAAKRPFTDAFAAEDQPLLERLCASLEGKTARQKNPHPKGSLAFAAWTCARLGGWTGYYGKPGPLTMLRGVRQLHAVKLGYHLRTLL
jgi:Transposase DDE domain